MSSSPLPQDASLRKDQIYQEIRADIRATDEISFKLLGLVPLATGTAFLAFLFTDKPVAKPEVVSAVTIFAALVTLGLFRWELRNVQICNWLQGRVTALEVGSNFEENQSCSPSARPPAPLGIGKGFAETIVYSVTILAWLVMPIPVCITEWDKSLPPWFWRHIALAIVVAVMTILPVLMPVFSRLLKKPPNKPGEDAIRVIEALIKNDDFENPTSGQPNAPRNVQVDVNELRKLVNYVRALEKKRALGPP
jgi:hypothetical protein